MNILDYAVNDSIKTNKDRRNDSIENDPKFDYCFNLSSGTTYPLPVATVSPRKGKKNRATNVAGLICLWDSGATYIMIKIR